MVQPMALEPIDGPTRPTFATNSFPLPLSFNGTSATLMIRLSLTSCALEPVSLHRSEEFEIGAREPGCRADNRINATFRAECRDAVLIDPASDRRRLEYGETIEAPASLTRGDLVTMPDRVLVRLFEGTERRFATAQSTTPRSPRG